MTVSITHFLKNAAPEWRATLIAGVTTAQGEMRRRGLWAVLWVLGLAFGACGAHAAEVRQLQLERADDSWLLSAHVPFEVAPVVEDALLKGIPMFFVVEADIYRERWYWTDQRVSSAARTIRLAYQPLTRRWRVNVASGVISSSAGLRASLNHHYDSLDEALTGVQRLGRWRIADVADTAPSGLYRLEFSFRLDLSQLPRPFQIGVAGQSDWAVTAQSRTRISPELLRTEVR